MGGAIAKAMLAEQNLRLYEEKEEMKRQQQQQQGGGGGGGGGGRKQPLVPTVAELKMLRGMEIDIAQRTKEADIKLGPGGIDKDEQQQVKRLGDDQDQVHDLTNEMIKKLRQQYPGN